MRRKDCENRNHADAREDARPPVRAARLAASIALAVTPWTRDVEQTPILIKSNEARVAINRNAGTIAVTDDTGLSPVVVSRKILNHLKWVFASVRPGDGKLLGYSGDGAVVAPVNRRIFDAVG